MRPKVETEVLRDRKRIQTPVMVVNAQGGDIVLAVKPATIGGTTAAAAKISKPSTALKKPANR